MTKDDGCAVCGETIGRREPMVSVLGKRAKVFRFHSGCIALIERGVPRPGGFRVGLRVWPSPVECMHKRRGFWRRLLTRA